MFDDGDLRLALEAQTKKMVEAVEAESEGEPEASLRRGVGGGPGPSLTKAVTLSAVFGPDALYESVRTSSSSWSVLPWHAPSFRPATPRLKWGSSSGKSSSCHFEAVAARRL